MALHAIQSKHAYQCRSKFDQVPDSKIQGANIGLTWVLSARSGSHVGPINLAIRGTWNKLLAPYDNNYLIHRILLIFIVGISEWLMNEKWGSRYVNRFGNIDHPKTLNKTIKPICINVDLLAIRVNPCRLSNAILFRPCLRIAIANSPGANSACALLRSCQFPTNHNDNAFKWAFNRYRHICQPIHSIWRIR